jgi:hypothetical protein
MSKEMIKESWNVKEGLKKRIKDLKCLMIMFGSMEDLGLKEKGGKEC